MKRDQPRTEQEIYARMRAIISAWKEIDEKRLESRMDMLTVFENQLEAADMASVVLGGDPIDRS